MKFPAASKVLFALAAWALPPAGERGDDSDQSQREIRRDFLMQPDALMPARDGARERLAAACASYPHCR